MAEVEETLNRIRAHKGVTGVVIINNEGMPIKSTLEAKDTATYAAQMLQLVAKTRSVLDAVDSANELTFLRIRSRKSEIMVVPDRDYSLIVIQDPNAVDASN